MRTFLPLVLPLAIACAVEEQTCETPEAPTVTADKPAIAVEPATAPPVEIDARPPVPLDRWRQIKQAGEAAARTVELDARIAGSRDFAREHAGHQTAAVVLESLADALIEKGSFDADELAGHVEALAKLQPEPGAPTKLVGRYHLKHGLSTASGMTLLALTRERLAQDEGELALWKDERSREWKARRIAFDRAHAHLAEARLHLRDGALDRTRAAIARGQAEMTRLVKDIVMVDRSGEVRRTLAAGVLEELHVLAAEVQHREGDDTTARASLGQVLGVMDDVDIRRMYDRLRTALGVGVDDDRIVTAAAQPAQDFALKDLAGKTVKLSDYRGKVVLLTFFATWCGPCKLEMPLLQKFRRENLARGVEVLAVSIDDYNGRSRIAPFLAEAGLDMPVLLEEPAQLTSYNYSGVPALYVIDRHGNIAHARTGYDPYLKEKLEHEIQAVVEDRGDGGRKLLTIEQAPAGWGVLWQRPVAGDFSAAAIAPPLAGARGEVGMVGREGLMRWTADGHALPSKPVDGYTMNLDVTDLDGDGKRDWLISGYPSIKVLDHTGELYWQHKGEGWIELMGHRDFDGDGFQELVMKEGDRAIMMKAVPQPLWTSPAFTELESVRIDPAGGLVLQTDEEIVEMDARGKITARGARAPEGRTHSGRMPTADGPIDLFRGAWDPAPRIDHDLDGDGQNDVTISKGTGLIVYDTRGEPLLRLRSQDVTMTAALGDLDGKPGAELVLLVDHYGVVVLGKQD